MLAVKYLDKFWMALLLIQSSQKSTMIDNQILYV